VALTIDPRFVDQPYDLAGRHINPSAGTTTWQNNTERLRRKQLEVLALLASAHGECVQRQLFIELIWAGNAFVGERALIDTIAAIRRSLHDDNDHPIVRTIPRKGYQLGVTAFSQSAKAQAILQIGDAVPGKPGWTLAQLLCESESSATWLAAHAEQDLSCVLQISRTELHLLRLQREVTLLRYLHASASDCDRLVRIIDWRLSDAPYYLATEFVAGGSLLSWAQGGEKLRQMPMHSRLILLADVASALSLVHGAQVVHGRLNANNVLIEYRDGMARAKLAGFAYARLRNISQLKHLAITNAGFNAEASKGAEQPINSPVDAAEDVLALAVLIKQVVSAKFDSIEISHAPSEENVSDVLDPLALELLALSQSCFDDVEQASAEQLSNRLAVMVKAYLDKPPLVIAVTHTTDDQSGFSDASDFKHRFELCRKLGEGGMGEVYLAEQRHPVKRQVAIKLIKTGLRGAELLARFQAEQQVLALMNHPHVAAVYEAGSHEGGPYFAMEYVPGVEITHYCDQNRLSLRERIALFLQVCDGVLHAHQKAIIHRDLKPSNLLVKSTAEQSGVVKIIDFGVAKSMQGQLGSAPHTQLGSFVGSPLYSSPEQIFSGPNQADTRSDIYSLGMVLYELLAGASPYAENLFCGKSPVEISYILQRQEPPAMATRFASLDPALCSQLALHRRMRVSELKTLLRNDLSWVVAKCLERDPNDRYRSVQALTSDLQRWLDERAVEARPITLGYGLRKAIRRHRRAALMTMFTLTILATASVIAIYSALQARRALTEAQAAQAEMKLTLVFQEEQIRGINPQAMGVDLRNWIEAAHSKKSSPIPHNEAASAVVVNYRDLAAKLLEKHFFQPALSSIHSTHKNNPALQATLLQLMANVMREQGLYSQALAPQKQALALRLQILGDAHLLSIQSMISYGYLLVDFNDIERAITHFNQARAGLDRTGQSIASEYVDALDGLSEANFWLHSDVEGEQYAKRAFVLARQVYGELAPRTLILKSRYGEALTATGKLEQASAVVESLQKEVSQIPANNQVSFESNWALLTLRRKQNRWAEANTLCEQSRRYAESTFGKYHRETLTLMQHCEIILQDLSQFTDALKLLQEILERREFIQASDTLGTIGVRWRAGRALMYLGQFEEANAHLELAVKQSQSQFARATDESIHPTLQLAQLRLIQGRFDEVERLLKPELDRRCCNLANEILMRHYLGLAMIAQGQSNQARALFEQILPQVRSQNTIRSDWKLRFEASYALSLEPAASASLLSDVLQQMQKQHLNRVLILETAVTLSRVLSQNHQAEEALRYAELALKLGPEIYPHGHYLIGYAMTQKARALLQLGQVASAHRLLAQAKALIAPVHTLDRGYLNETLALMHSAEKALGGVIPRDVLTPETATERLVFQQRQDLFED
jgi:eukaryotic-like serine/threonine-protein kinase